MFNKENCNLKENLILKEIKLNGFVKIKQIYNKSFCKKIKAKLNSIVEKRKKKNHYWGNQNCQTLDNYFLDDISLIKLIYHPFINKLLNNLIDKDHVLISPCARNPQNSKNNYIKTPVSGSKWHTDSRFIQNGKGFKPSLCYTSLLFIDDFKGKSATNIIPKSHLKYSYPSSNKVKSSEIKYLEGKSGDMVIFDTALWHKMGESTLDERWGIFNMYGPWFMKPYHRFWDFFKLTDLGRHKSQYKRLLHHDSLPPKDHNESMVTLKRVRDKLKY